MWLVHKPTETAVKLANFTSGGINGLSWQKETDWEDEIWQNFLDQIFFEDIESEDFVILFEHTPGWSYGEVLPNGLRKIHFHKNNH